MVYKAEILEGAQRELRETVGYLAAVLKNPQAAEAFLGELDHQVALIENDPYLYGVSKLPELAARKYRVAFVKNYVMLSTLRGNTIYIAHIFHQRQDYADVCQYFGHEKSKNLRGASHLLEVFGKRFIATGHEGLHGTSRGLIADG